MTHTVGATRSATEAPSATDWRRVFRPRAVEVLGASADSTAGSPGGTASQVHHDIATAAADVLVQVGRSIAHWTDLTDLEINPLIVGSDGAVAVDVLISTNEER